jgi:hypothetical protein
MSMHCEVMGCAQEAEAPSIQRLEDDWTKVAVSLCLDHKKRVDAGVLRINRRTAQGRLEMIGDSVGATRR